MSGHTDNDSPPAAVEPVRGDNGRFAPGNPASVGQPFKPGISGNPRGRPAGVSYPGDWIRGLTVCTEAELQQIVDDPGEVISRRAAARMLLDTIDHTPEVRGRAMIRAMDRTEGKPGVTVTVDAGSHVPRSADIMAELAELINEHPELRAMLIAAPASKALDQQ